MVPDIEPTLGRWWEMKKKKKKVARVGGCHGIETAPVIVCLLCIPERGRDDTESGQLGDLL